MWVMRSFCRKQKKTPKSGGQLVMGVMSGKHNALERVFPMLVPLIGKNLKQIGARSPAHAFRKRISH